METDSQFRVDVDAADLHAPLFRSIIPAHTRAYLVYAVLITVENVMGVDDPQSCR